MRVSRLIILSIAVMCWMLVTMVDITNYTSYWDLLIESEEQVEIIEIQETTVNEETVKHVVIDDYIGKSIQEVEGITNTLNLVIYYENNPHVKMDEVYKQSIKSGKKVKEGTTLEVYVSTGEYSDWSTHNPMCDLVGNYVIEEKIEYSYRDILYTTSTSGYLEGWAQGAETIYTTYDEWSSWSSEPITESSSLQVQERQVKTGEKTNYTYSAYFSNDSSQPYLATHFCGECAKDMYGGTWVKQYITQTKPAATSFCNQSCPHINATYAYHADNGYLYYLESANTREVYTTEYRSRNVYITREYMHWKWNEWSPYSIVPVEATSDVEVRTRVLYRYVD